MWYDINPVMVYSNQYRVVASILEKSVSTSNKELHSYIDFLYRNSSSWSQTVTFLKMSVHAVAVIGRRFFKGLMCCGTWVCLTRSSDLRWNSLPSLEPILSYPEAMSAQPAKRNYVLVWWASFLITKCSKTLMVHGDCDRLDIRAFSLQGKGSLRLNLSTVCKKVKAIW